MDPMELLKKLAGAGEENEYEPLCSMTEDQVKEWDEILKLQRKSILLDQEADAKRSLFWVNLHKEMVHESRSLKVEVEDKMIMAEKSKGQK